MSDKYFLAFRDTDTVRRKEIEDGFMEIHRMVTDYKIIPEDEWDDYCSSAWHKSSVMSLQECRLFKTKTIMERGSRDGNIHISRDDYHTRLW